LSGGERNRVLLAQVFSKPSNLLVLDEPTNDLDVETLEVLEERLVGYSGTLLIVSHDRIFLDNVVTSVLVFEADGGVHEYVGGYSDWAKRGLALLELDNPNKSVQRESESTQPLKKSKPQRRKLSYKLQRELDALPDRLETMERTLQRLEEQSTQANFYTQPYAQTQAVLEKLTAQRKSLEDAMARWSELESLREQAEG
jgi:ATP-binding cassette subfamily F protein uup